MTTPASYHPADPESVFTYGAPQLKFGHGAADEIGYDLSLTGARRVLVVTDPGVAATGNPQRVADQMGQFGIEAHVFDGQPRRADRREPAARHRPRPRAAARGTPSSRSGAARASTPPRRSTC